MGIYKKKASSLSIEFIIHFAFYRFLLVLLPFKKLVVPLSLSDLVELILLTPKALLLPLMIASLMQVCTL
jgi:nitrate reductase gamma subunit